MKNRLLLYFTLILFTISTSISAQDSTYTKLWENGTKKEEGKFHNSKKNGVWNSWNQKGELTETSEYLSGEILTKESNEYYEHTKNLLFNKLILDSSDNLLEKREYKYQDNNTYYVIFFNEKGIEKSSGKISSNLKEGKWNFYDENGTLKETRKFKNDIDIELEEKRLKEIEKKKRQKSFTTILPTKDNIIIKIYRPKRLAGFAVSYNLLINDSNIVNVANGTYYEFEIKKESILKITAKTEVEKTINLDIKLGRTYFLKCEIRVGGAIGRPKLTIIDPTIGIYEIKNLLEN
jgi:hypothetical protein